MTTPGLMMMQSMMMGRQRLDYWRIYQNSATRNSPTNGYEWHLNNVQFYTGASRTGTATATLANLVYSDARSGGAENDFLSTSANAVFGDTLAGHWVGIRVPVGTVVLSVTYKNSVGTLWAPTSVKIQKSTNNGASFTEVITYADDNSTNLQTINL